MTANTTDYPAALSVHTPAPAPLPPGWPTELYTGTVLARAEARMAMVGNEFVPVVCLDMELDNALRTRLHVEQPFKPDHYDQAHFAAARLKKGMRVTVEAPLVGLRLVARNATHIHIIKPNQPNPQESH